MKKSKWILALVLIICMLTCSFFVGCKPALPAPVTFNLNDSNRLTWNEVSEAGSYEVKMVNVETGVVKSATPRRNYYSLSTLEEGDYEITVRSLPGNAQQYEPSAWSAVLEFHKDYENGCLYKAINNNTEYEISRMGTAKGNVIIPDLYRGKPVTSIADSAFRNGISMESVVIGQYVNKIGKSAFYNCRNMTSLTLPAYLTEVGEAAFQGCSKITSLAIPQGVTKLPRLAFANCTSLTQIDFGGVTEIADSAFTNLSAMTALTLPDSVTTLGKNAFTGAKELLTLHIGKGLTGIGQESFSRCVKLATVTFDENSSLTEIGANAFLGDAALTSVTLPENLSVIHNYAFANCEMLESVTLPQSLTQIGGGVFDGTALVKNSQDAEEEFTYADNWVILANNKQELYEITADTFKNGVVGIADYTFEDCPDLSRVALANTVRFIGKNAFSDNENLVKVDLSGSTAVEKIGESAFADCIALNNVTFNNGLKRIDTKAFLGCSSWGLAATDIKIPNTVKSIGADVFKNTAAHTNALNNSGGVVYADKWAVGYTGAGGKVEIQDGTQGISDYAFYNQSTITEVSGLNKISNLGKAAFYGCSGLVAATFGDSLTEISDYSFYKCTSLVRFNVPMYLQRIGRSTFYKCTSLTNVDLSTAGFLREIDDYAFYGASSLSALNLGLGAADGLTIGDYAFYGASALSEVTIPDTVTELGAYSFYKCTGLTTLTILAPLTEIQDYTFYRCEKLTSLTLPNSVESIGKYAFYRCEALTSLNMGGNVQKIGDYAFYNCTALQAVSLPNSVESIGKYAFKGFGNAEGAQSVLLHGDAEQIGMHAFYGNKQVAIYTSATAKKDSWNANFNSSRRPIVWGCTLDEGGSFVVSVTVTANTFENVKLSTGYANVSAPARAGYAFGGWATGLGGEAVYTTATVAQAQIGQTLYAVWTQVPPAA